MNLNQPTEVKHKLIDYLVNETNFFTTPLTTRFEYSYEGGLLDYCLSVYNNLMGLINSGFSKNTYNDDTLIIVSLFHTLYKIDMYKAVSKNVKVYCQDGNKIDELGHFNWEAQLIYDYNYDKTTNNYGDNGFTNYMIISRFLPLTEDEILAIKYFNLWEESKPFDNDTWRLVREHPLVSLLHCAITLTLTNE